MEIEYSRRPDTTFGDLYCGEVFYAEGDQRCVFMRIDEVVDENENTYNAVDMRDGTLDFFQNNEIVNRVKSKLVLS